MNFIGCLVSCAQDPQVVAAFTEQTGRDISVKLLQDPFSQLVDQVLALKEEKEDEDLRAFILYCQRMVWDRMRRKPREETSPKTQRRKSSVPAPFSFTAMDSLTTLR